ncbi:hypothetical protein BC829DRAFT_378647 [Chytridium lagenaria]|nr:hypothetical protein BC829DRAFT_378647 [Chytridium lagenaria]
MTSVGAFLHTPPQNSNLQSNPHHLHLRLFPSTPKLATYLTLCLPNSISLNRSFDTPSLTDVLGATPAYMKLVHMHTVVAYTLNKPEQVILVDGERGIATTLEFDNEDDTVEKDLGLLVEKALQSSKPPTFVADVAGMALKVSTNEEKRREKMALYKSQDVLYTHVVIFDIGVVVGDVVVPVKMPVVDGRVVVDVVGGGLRDVAKNRKVGEVVVVSEDGQVEVEVGVVQNKTTPSRCNVVIRVSANGVEEGCTIEEYDGITSEELNALWVLKSKEEESK